MQLPGLFNSIRLQDHHCMQDTLDTPNFRVSRMCYVVAEQNPFIGVSHMNSPCWRWGKDFLPLPRIRACILETGRYSHVFQVLPVEDYTGLSREALFFPPTLWPRNILWKKPRPISLKCKHPQSHYLNCKYPKEGSSLASQALRERKGLTSVLSDGLSFLWINPKGQQRAASTARLS